MCLRAVLHGQGQALVYKALDRRTKCEDQRLWEGSIISQSFRACFICNTNPHVFKLRHTPQSMFNWYAHPALLAGEAYVHVPSEEKPSHATHAPGLAAPWMLAAKVQGRGAGVLL